MPIAGANMVRKDFRGGLFSLLGLFAGTDAGANTLVVTDLGDATGDLVCDAQCTLREAIAAASSGDTITWSSTLPFPATTLLVAGSGGLLIDKNLTLLGPGAHQLTLDAQNASRVLTLAAPATAVTIDGLALAHGRLQGATGATQCDKDPEVGIVCSNGLPGESTAGGCLHASIAQLTLSGMDIHDCALISGRGGHGAYLLHTVFTIGRGFNGGSGGNAIGGAIYTTGALSMRDSSVHGVSATAGGGGNGGPSKYSSEFPDVPPGPAGAGASGGSVYGGALYSIGGATLINVTLSADSAVGGFGGYGGIYFDPNENPVGVGPGGSGGWVVGGVWLWQGSSKASFSTFHAGDYDLGAGGLNGGANGVFSGRFAAASDGSSPLTITKSVFGAAAATDPVAPASYCEGSAITVTHSIADHACAGATVTAPQLGPKTAGALGITTLPPVNASSPVVDAATDCLDADAQAVTHDANGEPRPQIAGCDFGAHELSNRVFAHGFE